MITNIARLLALPLVSAGIVGGAVLGGAAMAKAEVSSVEHSTGNSIVATPDSYATPPSPKCPGGAYTTGGRG
ncbi:MAG TPA: hypothetical protein VJR50_18160 [Mycobacterium sp.]|jgi:hypothetical protein|nr:hypothetical protein [Mycobacterium sp.]